MRLRCLKPRQRPGLTRRALPGRAEGRKVASFLPLPGGGQQLQTRGSPHFSLGLLSVENLILTDGSPAFSLGRPGSFMDCVCHESLRESLGGLCAGNGLGPPVSWCLCESEETVRHRPPCSGLPRWTAVPCGTGHQAAGQPLPCPPRPAAS